MSAGITRVSIYYIVYRHGCYRSVPAENFTELKVYKNIIVAYDYNNIYVCNAGLAAASVV